MPHNRVHFEKLVKERFAAGQSHSGVVIAVRRPPYEIAKRLLVVLNKITADEMKNRVVYV